MSFQRKNDVEKEIFHENAQKYINRIKITNTIL